MGNLSDIIIANEDEAASISAAKGNHLKRWDCLESKHIDTINLGTLSQILTDSPIDDVNFVAKFMQDKLLNQNSYEGPWVFLVPGDLQSALVALDEEKEEAVAEKWAATEEFKLARWNIADVEEYLHNLVIYARKAHVACKSLLLWISL